MILLFLVSSANVQRCASQTRVNVHGNEGYLSSHVTTQTGCGSPRAPWIIEVPPGQTVDMWLLDFGALGRHKSTLGLGCQQTLGFIVERNLGSNFTICGDSQRRKHLYTSKTNRIELNLITRHGDENMPGFLLQYIGGLFNTNIYIWLSDFSHRLPSWKHYNLHNNSLKRLPPALPTYMYFRNPSP
jgi:hypothetical protein